MDSLSFSAGSGASPRAGAKPAPCELNECREPSILVIESLPLCKEHLAAYCYSRMQECEQAGDQIEQNEKQRRAAFLEETRWKIASLLIVRTDFANIERARLLDILLWASELTEKQRERWPRCRVAGGNAT